MTKRDSGDLIRTLEESRQPSGLVDGGNWLRHKGRQEQIIDQMLLTGKTEQDIAEYLIQTGSSKRDIKVTKRRVLNHIKHVGDKGSRAEHNLPIIRDLEGKWKFDIKEIEEMLGEISQNHDEIKNREDSEGALPERVDVEYAESMLRLTPYDVVSLDAVLDQIEQNFKKDGKSLKVNWRYITKLNIELWFGNQR